MCPFLRKKNIWHSCFLVCGSSSQRDFSHNLKEGHLVFAWLSFYVKGKHKSWLSPLPVLPLSPLTDEKERQRCGATKHHSVNGVKAFLTHMKHRFSLQRIELSFLIRHFFLKATTGRSSDKRYPGALESEEETQTTNSSRSFLLSLKANSCFSSCKVDTRTHS